MHREMDKNLRKVKSEIMSIRLATCIVRKVRYGRKTPTTPMNVPMRPNGTVTAVFEGL